MSWGRPSAWSDDCKCPPAARLAHSYLSVQFCQLRHFSIVRVPPRQKPFTKDMPLGCRRPHAQNKPAVDSILRTGLLPNMCTVTCGQPGACRLSLLSLSPQAFTYCGHRKLRFCCVALRTPIVSGNCLKDTHLRLKPFRTACLSTPTPLMLQPTLLMKSSPGSPICPTKRVVGPAVLARMQLLGLAAGLLQMSTDRLRWCWAQGLQQGLMPHQVTHRTSLPTQCNHVLLLRLPQP